jgi:OmpA-OmpF porin, OOP family
MPRKFLLAATVLAAPFALSTTAQAQPITGLYVGAGAGANFLQQQQTKLTVVSPVTAPTNLYGTSSFETGFVALGSVGWGFGNGVRLEAEGNYRHNDGQSGLNVGAFNGREQKYGVMANALFDLDVGSPYVFPYIGVGVGYAWVERRLGNSGSFSGGISDQTQGGFAYQAIAGLSFPIPWVVGLSLTAEYRYYALPGDRTYSFRDVSAGVARAGSLKNRADFNHDLMLGLRYAFNVAPPAPPAAAVTPPPAVEAARTYMVFFDWDRADLTDRARQIIAEAAQATTRVQVTRIEVSGHTDRSGSPAYNQGLSVRRAQNVANELVRLGVPRSAITVQGFGESRPLVPTADGVREPQNRRVEIIFR